VLSVLLSPSVAQKPCPEQACRRNAAPASPWLRCRPLAALRLTAVAVSFAPDAQIVWEEGIRAYATAKTISDDQITAAANTPNTKVIARCGETYRLWLLNNKV
jgi:hypothetical protein